MRLAWVPLLLAGGCLYLGEVNDPPQITIDPPIAAGTNKGDPITIQAHVKDDQARSSSHQVQFVVAATDPAAPLDPCDFATSQSGDQLHVTFFRAGTFSISATAVDRFGAPSTSSASVVLDIGDAPPVFLPTAKPATTSNPNGCHWFSAGGSLTLGLNGGSMGVDDADRDAQRADIPGCATRETLHYTWRVATMPEGAQAKLTPFDGTTCAPPDAGSRDELQVSDADAQVCLWPDVGPPNGGAIYGVVLDVDDGVHDVDHQRHPTTSSPVTVSVGADSPPCITGTSPPTGQYVFDRAQPLRFEVTGIVDDLDSLASMQYRWSVWRQSDPVWRDALLYTGASYELDPSSIGVGEQVRVRVRAIDRAGLHDDVTSNCDADGDCAVTSCSSGTTQCFVWKTWQFELR